MRYREKVSLFPYRVGSVNRPGFYEQRVSLDIGIHAFLGSAYKEFIKTLEVVNLTGAISAYNKKICIDFCKTAAEITKNLHMVDTVVDDFYLQHLENPQLIENNKRHNAQDKETIYNHEFWMECLECIRDLEGVGPE